MSDVLDCGQLAALSEARVDLSMTRTSSLGELIYAWKLHITKLVGDMLRSSEDRTLWGAHDYVAALVLRDSIEAGMDLLGVEDRKIARVLLNDIDSLFKGYTEEDHDGCTSRIIGKESVGLSWWWGRIPRQGPVRREIEVQYRHYAGPH
ncbi:MAG: hypothetical protein WBA97_06735 [Actinophytocola sp.]|uniref:hypothetical protein n=1 Tax=Actinophytocola sp. TaxID=1872138 RepID=UPI003C75F68E